MEERSRLGRGIQELSRLYLSETPREDAGADGQDGGTESRRRIVRVIHPCSVLMGAFFTANFSLELARHRNQITVWDGSAQAGEGVEAMLGEIVQPGPASGPLQVRLYGLPDMALYRAGSGGPEVLSGLVRAARNAGDGHWLVIDTPHCMDAFVQEPAGFDAILLSTLEGPSLLQCYAYVKVIAERDPRSRISLVFLEPGSDTRAADAFSRFSSFARQRLGVCVSCLGHLSRDELTDRSITAHRPLVLGYEPSAARECIVAVARAFLRLDGAERRASQEA